MKTICKIIGEILLMLGILGLIIYIISEHQRCEWQRIRWEDRQVERR